MALDFICRETNQHLYEINDKGFSYLDVIFQNFYYRTGQRITPYDDIILDKNIQKILIDIIDDEMKNKDLNKDRERNLFIMEFRGVLNYFLRHKISVICYGD